VIAARRADSGDPVALGHRPAQRRRELAAVPATVLARRADGDVDELVSERLEDVAAADPRIGGDRDPVLAGDREAEAGAGAARRPPDGQLGRLRGEPPAGAAEGIEPAEALELGTEVDSGDGVVAGGAGLRPAARRRRRGAGTAEADLGEDEPS
jgi:hypothetical protein